MAQQDYILRQIDVLGKIIGKVISELLGIKNKGEIIEIEILNQILKSELDMDIYRIFMLSDEELIKFLIEDKNFNFSNIEQTAEILYITGLNLQEIDHINSYKCLNSALNLLEFLSITDKNLSFNRINKIENIKKIIN
jgi:hypothetical protein